MSQLITNVDELTFSPADLPAMPLPKRVLMVEPTYFSVEYVINPHMADQIGRVDKMKARNEWKRISELFKQLGLQVHALEGQEGLPDMVFSANQSFPYISPEGEKQVVMGVMHADQRKKEVAYIEQWFRQAGYEIQYLNEDTVRHFEGCGDAIWHDGRRLLWGGNGFRSSRKAYEQISDLFGVPVILLQLTDEAFYHLDTCFCVLNEDTALIYPQAFTEEGLDLIYAVFNNVITAIKQEAKDLFACNAVCPNGRDVIIQQGCTDTTKKLRDAGFSVHEVETGEFLKSGGSVYCMKQLLW